MKIRYGIVGTGALGGFYGGLLAKSGQEVHFLLRSDFEFVNQNGLKVDSILGNFTLPEINAYRQAEDMPVCDVVLVCLKTTNNHRLAELIRPLLHANSMIVLIQNGLGLEEDLSIHFPGTPIAGGLAFVCAQKVEPGYIQHLDFGKLVLAPLNSGDSTLLNQVVSDFKQSGIVSEFMADLKFARWQKLVWNVPFNGLTVALNTTTDRLVIQENSRKLVHELMLEVIGAANSCGVPLKDNLAEQMIDMTLKMKPYAPSMKLDYDFGRPLEIDAIYSRPIKEALLCGYAMPKVSVLENQLRFLQAENR